MNFNELTTLNLINIDKDSIVRFKSIKKLCGLKYPKHNKGCPNLEKCKKIPFFNDIKELNKKYYYLLYANFDFKKYQELRKIEKPEWTENQVKCVLYWQNSIKKMLKEWIENNNNSYMYVLGCGSGFKLSFQEVVYSMESVGINVFRTLKNNEIKYDVRAKDNVKLVCLICSNIKIGVDE